jgi:hypothetical protein
MNIRLLTFITAFTLGTLCMSAQEDDVYKKFLKTTSVAIHKAQKEMMVGKKADMNGLLAKAVILQSNALRLYKERKTTEGVCNSNLARKYASEIIKSIKGNVEAFYMIHEDEKTLVSVCGDETELYNSSKKSMKNLSEADADYMGGKSLNNTNIDF